MIQDIGQWMHALREKLLVCFQGRLVFLGLQGSYQRGEATEDSDIDVVLVLDELKMDDLKAYKRILRTMPEHEKACGFSCGLPMLSEWARCDLFHLLRDTTSYCGDLQELVAQPSREDILTGIRLTVGNLYHEACHRYLHNDDLADQPEKLKGAFKTSFYVIQACEYLRTGRYFPTRGELLPHIGPTDRMMLETYRHWDEQQDERAALPESAFSALINWCEEKFRQADDF